jgi:hypothetical protein
MTTCTARYVMASHANSLALNANPTGEQVSLVSAHWPGATSRDGHGDYSFILDTWRRPDVQQSASTAVPNSTLTRQVGRIVVCVILLVVTLKYLRRLFVGKWLLNLFICFLVLTMHYFFIPFAGYVPEFCPGELGFSFSTKIVTFQIYPQNHWVHVLCPSSTNPAILSTASSVPLR